METPLQLCQSGTQQPLAPSCADRGGGRGINPCMAVTLDL